MTGYIEGGSATALVARFAPAPYDVGVDGLSLSASGTGLEGVGPRPYEPRSGCSRAPPRRTVAREQLRQHQQRPLARALARVVASERWDGLTVDLESLGVSDTIGLVRFLGNLRHDLVPSKGLSVDVSAATSLSAYAQMGYDLTAMSLDARIVLMAYDDHGPTWSGPGPVDRLAWQRASLSVLLSRVPSSRVVSGVAGYGYTWPAGARLHAGVRVADAQAFKMAIVAHVAARFDPVAGEYEATLLDGTVVWWSSDRSIRLRRALAIADRVPAIAVWELSSVDDLG